MQVKWIKCQKFILSFTQAWILRSLTEYCLLTHKQIYTCDDLSCLLVAPGIFRIIYIFNFLRNFL